MEKYKEYNKSLYMTFIDYTKAFDSINHDAIWESLEKHGIPSTYITIIRSIYSHSKGRIQLEALGDEFKIGRGVRQGDPLFPKLFSAGSDLKTSNLIRLGSGAMDERQHWWLTTSGNDDFTCCPRYREGALAEAEVIGRFACYY
ncbi:Retrovirus-related Pol polyprotein from type-1 retrotransposable element R2 [Eumeta japonica]|uniref:Retrovirus-related Pol polyprotein from type-1 retrotransposable element R2 n=1 Tax=Eumeta variegata TaxID=151549 RepID=A0A4C1SUS7_EUMVA|nr:Retrovirus-related Pol polyprotein from type-1 retrotransposable element R2 [Eumeta japonica]